jgi:hypothetical protein
MKRKNKTGRIRGEFWLALFTLIIVISGYSWHDYSENKDIKENLKWDIDKNLEEINEFLDIVENYPQEGVFTTLQLDTTNLENYRLIEKDEELRKLIGATIFTIKAFNKQIDQMLIDGVNQFNLGASEDNAQTIKSNLEYIKSII